ncbi:MAG: shikimate dehydrogenase [Lachnospiraceae bacterium]|nr:shikimate dehydrogenase [Lachnospiraceae bacterium]
MAIVNGHTRTCGLIGNPVEHTMSPVIHNNLADMTGNNLVYVPFHVPEGYVGDAVKGAYALNLLGMNVTVPYKSDVIPFLKEIDPLAEQIGAVNTLVRTEGGYKGYNTDMPGLYRAMCSDGVNLVGEKVLILGAGGVARAVAMLMAKQEVAQIILLNRTVERAWKIAKEVNEIAGKDLVSVLALEAYDTLPADETYLVIQATSVGMHPNVEDAVIEEEAFYKRVHTGYDLIFNPLETKFMKLVKNCGGEAFNGLKMLLYQGVIAYELWTGCEISENQAAVIFEKMLDGMQGK